jgi:hypothetical protein
MSMNSPTTSAASRAASKPKMSKTIVNFWLDTLLLILFMLVLWSTAVVRFVFPAGTTAVGWQLWGWSYDQWVDVQTVSISLLAFAVLIHVMLHWTWVCGVIAKRFSKGKKAKLEDGTRTLWGVGLLIVVVHVIGIGIAAAVLMIQAPAS